MAELAMKQTARTGSVRSAARNAHVRIERTEYSLVWPSGRGDEVGTVRGDPDSLWAMARKNGTSVPFDVVMHDVTEDGARSLIFVGLVPTPICLTQEPELPAGRLSVIADIGADVAPIRAALVRLFGDRVEMAG